MSFRKRFELKGHAGAVFSCAFDGQFVYSGSADKLVARWDIQTGTQDSFSIQFKEAIYALDVLDGLLFVGLANGDLHVFDTVNRVELKYFTQHKSPIFSVTVNNTKKQVYVGDANGNLSIWDASNLSLMLILPLNCGKIRDVTCSLGGSQFVVSGIDGYVRVFETENFNEIETKLIDNSGVMCAMFHSLNSDWLISGGKDALLKLYNYKTKIIENIIPAHNYSIYRLVSVGENIVSASKDKNVKIWSNELKVIQRLDYKNGGHRNSVNDLVIISENCFVSCSDDRKLIVWERF